MIIMLVVFGALFCASASASVLDKEIKEGIRNGIVMK